MRDRDLYAQILGIRAPWKVTEVDLDTAGETVEVHVRHEYPFCEARQGCHGGGERPLGGGPAARASSARA